MFTFVRILTRSAAERMQIQHNCQAREEEEEVTESISAHPWQQELDRLANCQCPGEQWPKAKYRSYSAPVDLPKKSIRQGTLTDQKVWWGRAINHDTLAPEQGFLAQYRRPPKTINHWQQ